MDSSLVVTKSVRTHERQGRILIYSSHRISPDGKGDLEADEDCRPEGDENYYIRR